MGMQQGPMHPIRPALILIAVFCVAVATPLLAQQAAGSTRATATASAQPSAHGTSAPVAQATSERFGRVGVGETRHDALASAAFAGEGGSHTIVISTLALVLIVIIVVLLIR